MRRSAILWILLLSFLSVHISAQIHNPVKWNTSHEQTADGEFDLIFTATIDDGWSVYSQYLESDDGPVRTCLLYTSPSPRDQRGSRMPSSA